MAQLQSWRVCAAVLVLGAWAIMLGSRAAQPSPQQNFADGAPAPGQWAYAADDPASTTQNPPEDADDAGDYKQAPTPSRGGAGPENRAGDSTEPALLPLRREDINQAERPVVAETGRDDDNIRVAELGAPADGGGETYGPGTLQIPFVPCQCSDPELSLEEWSKTRTCAVLDDGQREAGVQSLAPQAMDIDGLVTITDYVSLPDQQAIVDELVQSGPFEAYAGKSCQEFGMPFSFYARKTTGLEIPPLLQQLAARLVDDKILATMPNYVLVNRYFPGEGIHAHIDDGYYEDGIVSVTLLAGASLNFFRDKSSPYYKQDASRHDKYRNGDLLECGAGYFSPGSLFAMHTEARYGYKHEILRRRADGIVYASGVDQNSDPIVTRTAQLPRKTRYAVTFRTVRKPVIAAFRAGKTWAPYNYADGPL